MTLVASVTERGEILQVEVVSGSGSSLLDEAAIRHFRDFRFRPALLKGKPVPSRVRKKFTFVAE